MTFALTATPLAAVPEQPQFNEHIRPILAANCFACHGPDEKSRDAELRLDTRAGALEERDGVRAIVPGQPDVSALIERVLSHDRDETMPPPKAKKPRLSDEQIETLRRWIAQGAEYQDHWAFLPLRRGVVAGVVDPGPATIDAFIRARLARENLAPSPEADRATLIRRLALDLTGLLPTSEEARAFIEDAAPDAYEKLVDRLLASPHFGERWGRHWLDQARYADSNGYTIDSERTMWPYRDWVIRALNADMPFDQFTIEQLAGDLLPQPTKAQLIATAFHRNTLINEEGGTDKEQFRIESVIDRVNTTGAVWLGLTVGCAQCHTHKFDPIAHREYFGLFAFFNSGTDVNSRGATVDVGRGELFGNGATAEERAAKLTAARAERQGTWEKRELAREPVSLAEQPQWRPARGLEVRRADAPTVPALADGSVLLDREASSGARLRVFAKGDGKKIAAVRVRALPHESLPLGGPGTGRSGGFVLSGFEFITAGGANLHVASVRASSEEPGNPAAHAIDDDPGTGWAPGGKPGQEHAITFQFDQPIAGTHEPVEIALRHEAVPGAALGHFAVEFIEAIPAAPREERIAAALAIAPAQRTAEQAALVRTAFDRAEPTAKDDGARSDLAGAEHARLMVMKELPTPRPTFLLQRGDFLRPDKAAGPLQPGVIAAVNVAFPKPPHEFRTRLDLARWLVSPENPLTPRVTANRVWMRLFGRGLVETDDDFGTQGTPPTHPELLDWLALEFISGGAPQPGSRPWSVKHLIRRIVTSATYRQSSVSRPGLAEKDPRNLLLARQSRLRVEAEIIRDAALTASGLLDATIGGPGVRPPQPAGVYAFTQNKKKWDAATGADRHRRALYTVFFRSAPYPLFGTFDTPDLQIVCTRRSRSNSPLQALTVANDATFLEFAQGLAARVLRELPTAEPDARLIRAFQLCFTRQPGPRELAALRAFFERQQASFAADPTASESLRSPEIAAAGASPEISAALVAVARALFNTDSFITRE